MQNKGLEIAVGYKDRKGSFSYQVQGNVSYVQNKILDLGGEDMKIIDGFLYQKGKPASNIYGFVSEGLFTSAADVQHHADQSGLGGQVMAGDVKYKDLDPNGVIDSNDRADLGSYFPSVNYGLSLNCTYKNFDLSMLWQGVSGVDTYVTGRLARPFVLSNSPLKIQYADRARIDDDGALINPDAKFPRTMFSNPNNYPGEVADGRASSFFVKSAAFLKLRNVQVGYSLPPAIRKKLKAENLRIYVSVENLLTISKFNYYDVDPEIPSTGDPVPVYPTVRTFVAGLNITF
jgi:hypothetical protein